MPAFNTEEIEGFFQLAQVLVKGEEALFSEYRDKVLAAGDAQRALGLGIEFVHVLLQKHPNIRRFELPGDLVPTHQQSSTRAADWRTAAELFVWFANLPETLREEMARATSHHGSGSAANQVQENAFRSAVEVFIDTSEHLFNPWSFNSDALIKKLALAYRPRRVIDIGAGAGHYTLYLASMGCEVTSLEINPIKSQFLRFRAQARGLEQRIHYSRGPGAYDAVFAINMFDHLADASGLVAELASWLEPGGLLFYQAQFPEDGYHTSEPTVIDRVFRQLHCHFEPLYSERVPEIGLEVMRRRPALLAQPLGADQTHLTVTPTRDVSALVPVVHASVSVDEVDAQRCFVHSPMFYIRAASWPRRVVSLLWACDGRRTVRDIAEALQLPQAEVWQDLNALWERRVVGMRGVTS